MRAFSRSFLLLFGVAAGLAAGLVACDNASDGTGHVAVRLTDAPLDDFSTANVTITRVDLIGADSTRTHTLSSASQRFDLLRLRNGVTAALGGADVPEGRYQGLRLYVADGATVTMKADGSTETLKVPSGTQSGIKVNFPAFAVTDSTTLTVDFDVNDSFVKAGNSGKYIFKPVLKPALLVVNGDTLVNRMPR